MAQPQPKEATNDRPIPGLITAFARIASPDLTDATFNAWYDEHVQDTLNTGGVHVGLRCRCIPTTASASTSTSASASSVPYPYLAAYPIEDPAFLQSERFGRVKLHSDLLPGPNHFAFEAVDFEIRLWRLVGKRGGGWGETPHTLVLVRFIPPESNEKEENKDALLDAGTGRHLRPDRTHVYRFEWQMPTKPAAADSATTTPTSEPYLALHEYLDRAPTTDELRLAQEEWAGVADVGAWEVFKTVGDPTRLWAA